MSTSDTPFGGRRSAAELRQMDEDTARETLTVAEYERRQDIIDAHDAAEQTRDRWREQEATVTDVVVHADIDQLGTAVEVFGNDLVVHIDLNDRRVRAVGKELEALESEYEDVALDDLDALDDDTVAEIADPILELFDLILRRWNGTEWADLSPHQRQTILADARRKWNLDGVVLAWIDMIAAIEQDREERLEVMESFRGETRGRGR